MRVVKIYRDSEGGLAAGFEGNVYPFLFKNYKDMECVAKDLLKFGANYYGKMYPGEIHTLFPQGLDAAYVGQYTEEGTVQNKVAFEKMLDSYTTSIRQAGGDPVMFLEDLETMTVADMMMRLANNGVRFYYEDSE